MSRCKICDYSSDTPTLYNTDENQGFRRLRESNDGFICEECEMEINDTIREFEESDEQES